MPDAAEVVLFMFSLQDVCDLWISFNAGYERVRRRLAKFGCELQIFVSFELLVSEENDFVL